MRLSLIRKICINLALTVVTIKCFASQTIILAKDSEAFDNFGYSAVVDGNTLLVGAYKADIEGVADAGAAYVYVLGDHGWTQEAKLVANPHFAEDTLGGNVALSKDTAMLGVMMRDDKGKDSGAVIAFERDKKVWAQTQIITAPDANAGDAFGQSISLTDKYLVVGAPKNDTLGNDAGAAYIFKREQNAWRYQAKIVASDGLAGDLFGVSVAIDDDTIIVGADLHDEIAENAGAVYVFRLSDSQWKQEAKLVAADGGKTDIFGVRVAISEDIAIVSARRDDVEGIGVDAGSAYIFERSGTTWAQKAKLTSPDGKADDRFGRGVALDGNMAIISAMNHDANGADTGAIYVFKNTAEGWSFNSKITAKLSLPNDRFGWNVDLSGDLAVIASPHHDGSGEDSGAIFVQTLSNTSK
ncbi:FG-GAP repeat protein [Alteromonas gracilis]|uniref:FG-GAP repeat protein n=1 Tax=Alteromonas gracilis TaxID=1479524 RepID=UPI003735B45B